VKIKIDDLRGDAIKQLLQEHLEDMHRYSPKQSVHALNLEQLRKPEVTFWSAWEDDDDNNELLGCGALKELSPEHGEIKSMRTVSSHLGRGVASAILTHILDEAKRRNYKRVSLETGSQGAFLPARRLYAKFGFKECGPFGEYLRTVTAS